MDDNLKEPPKLTSTGIETDPETNLPKKASESSNEVDNAPKRESIAEKFAREKMERENRAKENQPSSPSLSPPKASDTLLNKKTPKPLEKGLDSIKGEIVGGDGFLITAVRGDLTFKIPVALETNRDLVTLDNTFSILEKMLDESREGLDETYASFVHKGGQ